jgi:hypothetical protein
VFVEEDVVEFKVVTAAIMKMFKYRHFGGLKNYHLP